MLDYYIFEGMIDFFVFAAIGFLSYTFILIQSILSISVSIPCTKTLKNSGIDGNYSKIYIRIISTIITCIVIFIAACAILYVFHPNGLSHFISGIGIGFIFSIKKLKFNSNNLMDFLKTYSKYLYTDLDLNRLFSILVNKKLYYYMFDMMIDAYKYGNTTIESISQYCNMSLQDMESKLNNLSSIYGSFVKYRQYIIYFSPFHIEIDNQVNTVHTSKRKHTSIVIYIIIFVFLAICSFEGYLIYSNNITIKEQDSKIASLEDKADILKDENKNYKNQLDYIYNFKRTAQTSEFHTWFAIMVIDTYDTEENVIVCSYDGAIIHSETDNNNIQIEFCDEWIGNLLCFKVKGLNSGCSTITFTNNINDSKINVLVIVK